jgi:hypothetical protein
MRFLLPFTSPFLLSLFPIVSFAQSFYVDGKDNRSREHVEQKIKYEGYNLSKDSSTADYIVQLLVDGEYKVISFKRAYHGYIRIVNNKTSQEVGRTQIVKKDPSAVNGFNASYKIFTTISKKYLVQELKKCTASNS